VKARLVGRMKRWQSQREVSRLSRQVAANAKPRPGQPPVAFFNASARLDGLSQNAAFSLLTSWALQLSGTPVAHFVCHAGMSRCVQGTRLDDFNALPPCKGCIAQSERLYADANVGWFRYQANSQLASTIQGLNLAGLSSLEYPDPSSEIKNLQPGIPLGPVVLPALRWALRRHHLPDDEPTRSLFREYILSAFNVAQEFSGFLDQANPAAVVIFNGILYPEAVARWVAQQRGVRVITHEVSFQPFSAFFTDGQATAYPYQIPDEFELTPQQDQLLNEYLGKRFQGQFTMAGIRFWPEMKGLDEGFLAKVSRFQKLVPVFTNVVFDTSQVHANSVFPHMFAWLDLVLELIRNHPETLFVIRAHPDEMRPGSTKQSRESVHDWVYRNQVQVLPNVVFIDSLEYISSYELIQRAKFVMVYNSSIGLEATLMGKPVLCGGQARFTQYPIVYFPDTPARYLEQAESFLAAEKVITPAEFLRNARRFLYFQLYRASLPFGEYLESGSQPGYVKLREFAWQNLLPEQSPTMQVIVDGILNNQPFLLSN
jgi:hypothetical protein